MTRAPHVVLGAWCLVLGAECFHVVPAIVIVTPTTRSITLIITIINNGAITEMFRFPLSTSFLVLLTLQRLVLVIVTPTTRFITLIITIINNGARTEMFQLTLSTSFLVLLILQRLTVIHFSDSFHILACIFYYPYFVLYMYLEFGPI
jgi:hypothetical protein